MSHLPRLATLLLTPVLAATAAAQNRLFVPSQYSEIGIAVQNANPGDIIEVDERVPPYQPFVIDRSITIVGTAGEHAAPTVRVAAGIGIDIQLAPGERVALSRIDVQADPAAGATTGVNIQGGQVTLEDCRFRSGPDLTAQVAAVEIANSDVLATFCRFEGGRGGTALRATSSYVALTDTRCFGGTLPAGDGVVVQESVLHTTEAWLIGGDDFLGGSGGVALRVIGNSQTTVREGSATGGIGQPGGSGLVNTSANPVEFSGIVFAGGTDFTTQTQAPDVVGPTTNNPALVGVRWNEPPYRRGTLRPGETWNASVLAAPSSLALLAFSFEANGFAALFSRQPALLPGDVALIEPFITDGFGYGTIGGTLPNDPNLSGASLWAQGVAGVTFPLEASPPSGVVVR